MPVRTNILISFYTALLLLLSINLTAQDTTELNEVISTSFTTSFGSSSVCEEYSIRRYPAKDDSLIFQKSKHLLNAEPSDKNYHEYFLLACSLWQLGKLKESEGMFLRVLNSKKAFYTGTYYRSSDIPGDTSTNVYGYGSYSYNYKNRACIFLTRINLMLNNCSQALVFIKLADKRYTVTYNCGTGHRWYREDIDGLYGLCYDGLEMYDIIINEYMREYSDDYSGILVKAIRSKYTRTQIDDYITTAEKSIECRINDFQSSAFNTSGYGANEKITFSKYTSGIATINLFGIRVDMPQLDLKDGDTASRELFFKEFKESGFYKALIK